MLDEPLPQHLADYEWAQAITNGDPTARTRFANEYSEKILMAVYIWCKPLCNRKCHLRRTGIHKLLENFLRQDCERISEAYWYLLDQCMRLILNRYKGQSALDTYLYSVLNPNGRFFRAYRTSFLEYEKGKIVLDTWTKVLTGSDREVLKYRLMGLDVDELAWKLGTSRDEVELAIDRIEAAARAQGEKVYWRHFVKLHMREVDWPTDEHGEPRTDFADDDQIPVDFLVILQADRSRVRAAVARLAPLERRVLILRFESCLSRADVADALNMGEAAVKFVEQTALRRLREFLLNEDLGPSS